jgi:hypothetical protein
MAVPGGISVGPTGPVESALLPATKGPRSASDDVRSHNDGEP